MRILFVIFLCFMLSLGAEDVCFITLHSNASLHFAKLAQVLTREKISWQVMAGEASEAALKEAKVAHHKISVWTNKKSMKELSPKEREAIAKLVVKTCKKAKVVVTDISEGLMVDIHKELASISSARRFVYYDNPEGYVPGEYSLYFEEVLRTEPQGVVFANKHLKEEDVYGGHKQKMSLDSFQKVGLGLMLMDDAEKMLSLSHTKQLIRQDLFEKLGIKDEKQKLLVYLGGCNTLYFYQAFPFFLRSIEENIGHSFFENALLLLQQHPRAKQEGSIDLYELLARGFPFQVFLSPIPTLEMLSCADLVYYYQSSLIPKIALAKKPLVQVTPEPLEDMTTRLRLVDSVLDPKDFVPYSLKALSTTYEQQSLKRLQEALGYDEKWETHFIDFVRSLF